MRENKINLVLAGGGVKGISYIGVFEAIENRKITIGNITGVSAGALAGAYAAAGYSASEMKEILYKFDFSQLSVNQIPKKIPLISRYLLEKQMWRHSDEICIDRYIKLKLFNNNTRSFYNELSTIDSRGDFFKNLISLCKEGCLFNGDYLEQWISKVLLKKGIRTFEDLRGGISDESNPKGYKIRMTAVDAFRGKIIVLPDDIEYYDMNPDKLEVAKAVRMSTSVPFAFKPVELKKKEGGKLKTYHIIDGGVLDNMPDWLINKNSNVPVIGFKFKDDNKNKIINVDTPLKILNHVLTAVHDTGVPKYKQKLEQVTEIDASKVSFLEFSLKEEEKEYLYQAGKNAANIFFSDYKYKKVKSRNRCSIFHNVLKRIYKTEKI